MRLLVTGTDGRCGEHQFADCVLVTLGRDPTCDVVLDDLDVSRKHIILESRDENWFLTDQSSNGSYVRGEYLCQDTVPVDSSSEVRVGPFSIRVLPANEDSAADVATGGSSDEEEDVEQTALRRELHRKLLDSLDLAQLDREGMTDAAMRPQVLEALRRLVAEVSDRLPDYLIAEDFVAELLDEALGLGPLERLLADDEISEIMVVDPKTIYCERNGTIERSSCRFTDDASARAVIERIVTPLGRRIDESTPFVDARLKDGSRVNAVIRPLALRGACITIRKFTKNKLSLQDLVRFDSMNQAMSRFLDRSVRARKNIVISGGTGSGKTTLLNVLSQSIAAKERVVTIEDAAELQLRQEHVVSLEARPANMEGRGEISIRDLVRNALRMRPDRILVGECRGGEAIDMLQAMNTGHDGSMTTTHANNPREALARIETLVLMSGLDLPSRAIREQIVSSVDLIVQQTRLFDGSRRVTSVTEVVGIDDAGTIETQEIFAYVRSGTDEQEKAVGRYQATGYLPTYLGELIRLGLIAGDQYL